MAHYIYCKVGISVRQKFLYFNIESSDYNMSEPSYLLIKWCHALSKTFSFLGDSRNVFLDFFKSRLFFLTSLAVLSSITSLYSYACFVSFSLYSIGSYALSLLFRHLFICVSFTPYMFCSLFAPLCLLFVFGSFSVFPHLSF